MEMGNSSAAQTATANENVHNHKLSEWKSKENITIYCVICNDINKWPQTLFYKLKFRRNRLSTDLLGRVAEIAQSMQTIQHTKV